MEHFFITARTAEPGMGFAHFGVGHCVWLAVWLLVCLGAVCLHRYGGDVALLRLRRVGAAFLLLDECLKYAVTVPLHNFYLDLLPLHLCSINLFVILADVFLPLSPRVHAALHELLFAICLPGAFFALLFPGWAYLPLDSALCVHSFVAHILLFLDPFLLLLGGFCPRFLRFAKWLPFCFFVAIVVYFLNFRLHTNFMFLKSAGQENPLAWLEEWLGAPGYLFGMILLCGAVWALLYGAAAWCRTRTARKRAHK